MTDTASPAAKLQRGLTITQIVFCLVLQSATMIAIGGYWVGQLTSKIEQQDQTNARQDAETEQNAAGIKANEAEVQRMQVGAATVGAQLSAMRDSLADLKDGQRELIEELRRLSQEAKP